MIKVEFQSFEETEIDNLVKNTQTEVVGQSEIAKPTNLRQLINHIAMSAFDFLKLSGDALIELNFMSKEEIQAINAVQRNKDSATDVLSFPYIENVNTPKYNFTKKKYPFEYDNDEKSVVIGSVLICTEIAKIQAAQYNHSVNREIGYLFLHGLLHILGYDHEIESDKKIMRETEENILSRVSLKRDD